jgi:hypothetical protein
MHGRPEHNEGSHRRCRQALRKTATQRTIHCEQSHCPETRRSYSDGTHPIELRNPRGSSRTNRVLSIHMVLLAN